MKALLETLVALDHVTKRHRFWKHFQLNRHILAIDSI
jgi:hypothetical protein